MKTGLLMPDSTEMNFQNSDTFWALIDKTRNISNGDVDKQKQLITDELSMYSPEIIIEFDKMLHNYRDRAYRQSLWDAAYLINCGCGDSSFKDFRDWLIMQGKDRYEAALSNPETLADFVEPGTETFAFVVLVAVKVYEEKTGQQMKYHGNHPVLIEDGVPSDLKQSEEELEKRLAQRYSKLHKKFGDCAAWL